MSRLASASGDRDRSRDQGWGRVGILTALMLAFTSPTAAEDVNCCVQPYSYFDCKG